MTLIEISLSIALMMTLASVVIYSVSGVGDWKKARDASIELRNVYIAQKSYLADHPTESVSSLTSGKLIPYLASGGTSIPTVEILDGSHLSIRFTVMPPVIDQGGG
ncbi:MAG: type II secretion system protein [Verrucomicrobiae bacterium]|nr:type II secretion system protein [Verrucomicrobiae bacterium]